MAETNGAKAPEIETVKMSDGRSVDFPGKRKMSKENLFNDDGRWIGTRFDFRFAPSAEYPANTITFKAPSPSDTVQIGDKVVNALDAYAAHGASQKLGDNAAGAGEKDTPDPEDMFEAVAKGIEQVQSGVWRERREGGGMSGTSVLLRALVLSADGKKTVEDARALLKTLDAKTKLALRNSPKLKPYVDKLEAEKASKASKVDTSAVLADWA
jgi:hypothetical protein